MANPFTGHQLANSFPAACNLPAASCVAAQHQLLRHTRARFSCVGSRWTRLPMLGWSVAVLDRCASSPLCVHPGSVSKNSPRCRKSENTTTVRLPRSDHSTPVIRVDISQSAGGWWILLLPALLSLLSAAVMVLRRGVLLLLVCIDDGR